MFTEYLRSIDVFSNEPMTLTFGDPAKSKTRNLWKTAFGGCTTILFLTVLLLYVVFSFIALSSGDKDMIEDTTREAPHLQDASLSLFDMKVMPVVTVNIETPHIYIDSSSTSFKKNIFVALLQESIDDDGHKRAEFEQFVPCTEVSD